MVRGIKANDFTVTRQRRPQEKLGETRVADQSFGAKGCRNGNIQGK